MKSIIQIIVLILYTQMVNGQSDIKFTAIKPPYKSNSPIIAKRFSDQIGTDELWLKVEQSGLPSPIDRGAKQ
jgi:hypothetical protein